MTTGELLQKLIEQQRAKQTQPAFILLPPPGQPCKWTGLSRRDMNALILATPENNFNPPVKSFVVRQKGVRPGLRLIDLGSLLRFIRSQTEAIGPRIKFK